MPKAHVARMRLAMPATRDDCVNDVTGDPLFVVTAEANVGLVKMLPVVLDDVRGLVGERRVTVVFDRGGYSPKLFAPPAWLWFDARGPRYPKGHTPAAGAVRREKGRGEGYGGQAGVQTPIVTLALGCVWSTPWMPTTVRRSTSSA